MKKYTLRIIPNNENIAEMYRNHNHYNKGDAGLDLFAPTNLLIEAGETRKLSFDISCEVICQDGDKTYNVSYYLYCRSSIYKTNIRMSNNVGIIDKFYRGNLGAPLDNIKAIDYIVEAGDRLFQICTPDLTPFHKVVVAKSFLNPSLNRKGGFGSTGK